MMNEDDVLIDEKLPRMPLSTQTIRTRSEAQALQDDLNYSAIQQMLELMKSMAQHLYEIEHELKSKR